MLERRVLTGLMLALIALALYLLSPLWPWLVLSLWTAMLCGGLFNRLATAIRGRSGAAALITVSLVIAILLPIGVGLAVVAPDVYELAQRAMAQSSGRNALVELVSTKAEAGAQGAHVEPSKLMELVQEHGKQALTAAALLASIMGSILLGVVSYFVATYAALVHGGSAYAWVRERLPLKPETTDRLRDTFNETGRGLLFSVALTALAQAGLATIAYLCLGVPRALALGLATFITSVVPAIGPFLVWGPVALGLLLAGHPIKAAILTGVCAIVVAPADNVLRPLFAKLGKLTLHPLLVFFSMLGGVVTFGGWGLMLGPLVFRMAIEVIAIVAERGAGPRQPSQLPAA